MENRGKFDPPPLMEIQSNFFFLFLHLPLLSSWQSDGVSGKTQSIFPALKHINYTQVLLHQ